MFVGVAALALAVLAGGRANAQSVYVAPTYTGVNNYVQPSSYSYVQPSYSYVPPSYSYVQPSYDPYFATYYTPSYGYSNYYGRSYYGGYGRGWRGSRGWSGRYRR
jgi:hypothetical protein